MAIYHLSAYICSGNRGSSAVASAAYQSGERLWSSLDGLVKDYDRKERVIKTEILLPRFAPQKYLNRETLWNSVESVEGVKGQYCRKWNFALPRELTIPQNIKVAETFCRKAFTDRGMICDLAFHIDTITGDLHAHAMTTMRPLLINGSWGKKDASVVVREKGEDGKMHPIPIGRDKHGRLRYKRIRKKTTDWDRVETLKAIRKEWADVANEALAQAGSNARIDHRSYKEQGIDKLPTKHFGPQAWQMEQELKEQGKHTEIGAYNEEVQKWNKEHENLKEVVADAEAIVKEIEKINGELADINAVRMQLKATEQLAKSIGKRQYKNNEKYKILHQKLYDEWYNESTERMVYGSLRKEMRPTGLFAGRKKRAFDRARHIALKHLKMRDRLTHVYANRVAKAEEAVRSQRQELSWINPDVYSVSKNSRKMNERMAQLTLSNQEDDKGMSNNRALLTKAAREEEENKKVWRSL